MIERDIIGVASCIVWLLFSISFMIRYKTSKMRWGIRNFRVMFSIGLSIMGFVLFIINVVGLF